jgi:TolB-like protein/Tfp pilus assembly protein PilF
MKGRDGFLAELRRRNVFRMAGLYLLAAWLIVQVAGTVLPMFGAPEWLARSVVVLLALGFPPALVFAWVFELTPGGLKRDASVPIEQSIAAQTGRRMEHMIVALLVLALGYFALDKFVLAPRRDATVVAAAGRHASGDDKAGVEAQAIEARSIAVLPLVNASGDDTQQFFSDGLSENLIIALSQFDGLKVIGRNSAFRFRDSKDNSAAIGRKLGVAHLLEGSVQHAGDAVRISVELISAATGRTLWSQRYDRPYKDLFKLQDEITDAVAGALEAKLLSHGGAVVQSDRPPSGSLQAYNAYLRGNFHAQRNTEAGFRKAIDAFGEAIELDPHYALAWARQSLIWSNLGAFFLGGAEQRRAYGHAKATADQALLLAPDLAAAEIARGNVLVYVYFDFGKAEAAFRRALQLAPNDGRAMVNLSTVLAARGDLSQAVALIRQALQINPLYAGGYVHLSNYLEGMGRLDQAVEQMRKAIELEPAAQVHHAFLTMLEVERGDARAALDAARQEPAGVWRIVAQAFALQVGGDRAAADAALQALIDTMDGQAAYQIAEVYALRRDPDKTFEWLDRAWAVRDPGVSLLLYDPFVLRYRDDPRFAAYCRKVGLPATTQAKAMP